jgi:threonylcarbamoyladenosine tRNA methylthiotransferase CDKAL1
MCLIGPCESRVHSIPLSEVELYQSETVGNKKRVWVETYGCSASMADSEIIKGILVRGGYGLSTKPEMSDVNLIVTCGVKESTEHRMLSRITALAQLDKPLVVAGCLPKSDRALLERYCPEACLLGPHSLDKTLDVVNHSIQNKRVIALNDSVTDKVNLPRVRFNHAVSIIQISSGCMSDCSFCQTKLAKGHLRSYRQGDILRQMEYDVADGCKEIWLTSTDNGCYGLDINTNLAELLDAGCKIPGEFKVRVGMMNPIYLPRFMDKLLVILSKSDKLFKFLHIPVQSGSERILRKMKRGHTSNVFRQIVDVFRTAIPEITIGTDLIAGFPAETDEDFQMTVDLIKATKPDVINSSKFSPRPGTVASKFTRIDTSVVKTRTKKLHDVIRQVTYSRNLQWKGWEGEILVDEVNDKFIQGRNYAYKPVVLDDLLPEVKIEGKQLLGKKLTVKVKEVSNFCLKGSILT